MAGYDSVHFIADDSTINALFSPDEDKATKAVTFLEFVIFRVTKAGGEACFCETTPRIQGIIKEKIQDDEIKYKLANYITPNAIASYEDELTLEQEVIDLCNANLQIKPDIVLMTEKAPAEKYAPSQDPFGNHYVLDQRIVTSNLDNLSKWLVGHEEFQQFRRKDLGYTTELV